MLQAAASAEVTRVTTPPPAAAADVNGATLEARPVTRAMHMFPNTTPTRRIPFGGKKFLSLLRAIPDGGVSHVVQATSSTVDAVLSGDDFKQSRKVVIVKDARSLPGLKVHIKESVLTSSSCYADILAEEFDDSIVNVNFAKDTEVYFSRTLFA